MADSDDSCRRPGAQVAERQAIKVARLAAEGQSDDSFERNSRIMPILALSFLWPRRTHTGYFGSGSVCSKMVNNANRFGGSACLKAPLFAVLPECSNAARHIARTEVDAVVEGREKVE